MGHYKYHVGYIEWLVGIVIAPCGTSQRADYEYDKVESPATKDRCQQCELAYIKHGCRLPDGYFWWKGRGPFERV